jgi:hypothetical protein
MFETVDYYDSRRNRQMSSLFQVKDKVVLAQAPHVEGIVVAVLTNGMFKILWDRDWETGKTFICAQEDIELSRARAK